MNTQPRPRLPSKPAPMTKEQFMIEYVLRRAAIHPGGLEGSTAAKEASYAWDVIQSRKGTS